MISKDLARHFESCKRDIYEIERQISDKEIQFESPVIGKLTIPVLQSLYHAQIQSNETSNMFMNANLVQDVAESVVKNFQKLVNALPNVAGLQSGVVISESNPNFDEMMIRSFVMRLTRATAILGANRVIELLNSWLNGESLDFIQYFYIHGISVETEYKISDSVSIVPFTKYQYYIKDLYGLQDLPEGALYLVVRSESSPFLKVIANEIETIGDDDLIDIVYDTLAFCDVLSLETGHHINVISSWCVLDELKIFGSKLVTEKKTFNDVGIFSGIEKSHKCVEISSSDVELALKLKQNISEYTNNQDSLKIAINRWRESMRLSVGFWDQAINLRIALEALYLADISNSGEFGFRLSSRCAWHLGKNLNEREEIFFLCRDFYGIGSKAVHGNNVRIKDHEVAIVAKARVICRQGILKTILDNKRYEWNKVIVGATL